MIKSIPDMAWAADIMTGQKPFPTFNKERKGEGFKELLEKEMEKNERIRRSQTDRQHL